MEESTSIRAQESTQSAAQENIRASAESGQSTQVGAQSSIQSGQSTQVGAQSSIRATRFADEDPQVIAQGSTKVAEQGSIQATRFADEDPQVNVNDSTKHQVSSDSTGIGAEHSVSDPTLASTLATPLLPRRSVTDNTGQVNMNAMGTGSQSLLHATLKNKVVPFVKMEKQCRQFGADTRFMQQIKQDSKRYALYLSGFIIVITACGVAMAQSRVALFHIRAVGKYDNGKPYMFTYAWTVTLMAFVAQTIIFLIKRFRTIRRRKIMRADKMRRGSVSATASGRKANAPSVKKFSLVLLQSVLEIVSQFVTSWALVSGVPGTIFVVFKSSGVIFLAIVNVWFNKKELGKAQWVSFLVLVAGHLLASAAERGPRPGRGGRPGRAGGVSIEGLALLLLGEMIRAVVLLIQEVSLTSGLWAQPIALQGFASIVGLIQTLIIMAVCAHVPVTLPDGTTHPLSDWEDVLTMCSNSKVLVAVLVAHLLAQVASEVSHMMILKHISAIARSICDAFKILAIWVSAKLYWYFGFFHLIAEPWHPGFTGSVMMVPSIVLVVYGMLMYKENNYQPVHIVKDKSGKWKLELVNKTNPKPGASNRPTAIGFDGCFYDKVFSKALKSQEKATRRPEIVVDPRYQATEPSFEGEQVWKKKEQQWKQQFETESEEEGDSSTSEEEDDEIAGIITKFRSTMGGGDSLIV